MVNGTKSDGLVFLVREQAFLFRKGPSTSENDFEIQWNLPIKGMLGQGVLSFIERFPLFKG